ncbi:iron-sulfur cluster assembly scaffold protein [Epibacterium ulvae]|uniref:NifU homolog involved in Fe-S cluster formation n=1 Tax=Epibacterium ulvae TaxID=1156985 RepID=A0A1G5QAL5_9RHOB|nr:iron-sulfur cluster assembly scaffold protein [Epibacterium ulvae]SCZ58319.1 NifU homolog involved in Fe-S cluster formation [Epibacterium ulvae]
MPADTDLIKLYSQKILALAADMPHVGRLDTPDATVKKRSPLCGSTVTVDLTIAEGRITSFAQDVKACALGQAAASILGAVVIGCTSDTLNRARQQLKTMLTTEDGPVPLEPFDGFEVLLPAREFKNRHASIMLALDATLEAFEQAEAQHCA